MLIQPDGMNRSLGSNRLETMVKMCRRAWLEAATQRETHMAVCPGWSTQHVGPAGPPSSCRAFTLFPCLLVSSTSFQCHFSICLRNESCHEWILSFPNFWINPQKILFHRAVESCRVSLYSCDDDGSRVLQSLSSCIHRRLALRCSKYRLDELSTMVYG